MSWSYSATDLNTTTASGRLNSVRLLIGDTDTSDQLVQNEEINFGLSQANDNIYYAAAWACRSIAAKFSRLVDTQLDGALSAKYSSKAKQYQQLASQVEAQGKKTSGKALGVFAGGISNSDMSVANQDSDRVVPAFGINRFDNVEAGDGYLPDEPNGV
jgi:hypothetical protein